VSNSGLRAEHIDVSFGGVAALTDVTVEVPPATVVGLIGANGAGKSTLFGVLSGLLSPNQGRVSLGDDDITKLSPQRRARIGLGRTFQYPQMFVGLTVREHVELAYRMAGTGYRIWRDIFTPLRFTRLPKPAHDSIDRILDSLDLTEFAGHATDGLPLGVQRRVELARAIGSRPSVLLLDEPSSGLASDETKQMGILLKNLVKQDGTSILLVEHDVDMVFGLAERIYVLDFGSIIAVGSGDEVRMSRRVQSAYLGELSGEEDEEGPSHD
jgi:branched-chain amino acid transport system ATP-binding protein